ncbi:hypothetical protein F8A87_11055 [Betaproteobacteria bacterium SCN2]|jgi:hypothetical protein|nr:hypothetical protein F8A87_11055 [Betaproteobacteria bacterium SCN2]
MNEMDWQSLIDAWIAGTDAGPNSLEYEKNWWAIKKVMDWTFQNNHDLLWQFILRTYQRELTDRTLDVLAAGPLEDLISKYGSIYIDRIEILAKKDECFNYLLGGVWQNTASDDIWVRVLQLRREVW